jgi:chaperonin GroES
VEFQPLFDRVFIKRVDAEDKSPGGILIPDIAKKKMSRGEVTAVGPGKRNNAGVVMPMTVKVGDMVLFGDYSGNEVRHQGEGTVLCLTEDSILAIVK